MELSKRLLRAVLRIEENSQETFSSARKRVNHAEVALEFDPAAWQRLAADSAISLDMQVSNMTNI